MPSSICCSIARLGRAEPRTTVRREDRVVIETASAGRVQRLLMGAVRVYRVFLSPVVGGACRFEPTCSVYALEALERHGAADGAYLATRRVLRCHPFCAGGLDPVPPASSAP